MKHDEAPEKVCLPEPEQRDNSPSRRGESTPSWLARSTQPKAAHLRAFLNRNIAALPQECQQNLYRHLRLADKYERAALAQEEIAVTGVIEDAPDKWDGTPTYGITDETTVSGTAPPIGYILEGDYSAYVGQRVTVYGVPRQSGEMRVLDVARIV
jgi:hypothetical protein